ncbi:MAG: DUF4249 family protein [Bacteroidales bacterium]
MKRKFFLSILMIAAILFSGCEKIVDIDYKNNQSRIVIDGNITNLTGPYYVKITKSKSLTEIDPYITVDTAVVVISDDAGNRDILIPIGNGIYRTTTIIGEEGRTYTLNIEIGDQSYTAQSTMPKLVVFDSIKVEEISFAGEIEYNLIPVYKNPIEKGNNYRFVLSVDSKLVNQHLVLNDEINNGQVNTLKLEVDDTDLKLKSGTLVDIEMQCIDKSVSLFYTTLALIGNNGPGGGTTPSNPPNNISNGALGLFSAHTTQSKSIVLP